MIIEYDEEDRCIRVNDAIVPLGEAEGMAEDMNAAIERYYHDHDTPDGHRDD